MMRPLRLKKNLPPSPPYLSPRLLLEAGANPWKQDRHFHRTCLHYAAAKGHAAVIRPVVERSFVLPQQKAASTSLMGRLMSQLDDSINNRWEYGMIGWMPGQQGRGRRDAAAAACVIINV